MFKISPKYHSSAGLFLCWVYLACCISFDFLDNPDPNLIYPYDPGLANPSIIFIPLYVLLNYLILIAYISFKKYGKYHYVQWFCFLLLSLLQTLKNIFTDPTIKQTADYIFLGIITMYAVIELNIKEKPNAKIT